MLSTFHQVSFYFIEQIINNVFEVLNNVYRHKIIIYSGNMQMFKHLEFIWWKYALPITYLHGYDNIIICILISNSPVVQFTIISKKVLITQILQTLQKLSIIINKL